ncbi:MAG TPA: phosphatase PAP2 family protein [Actinocrinis sp.]|nr:phosphatase PAP2 family protein [Actinocrinis sp.]
MPNLMWSWQQAVVIGGVLLAVWGLLRWLRPDARPAPYVREAGLVILLYALWQYAGSLSGPGDLAALSRGQWIWDTERNLHLLSEHTVQGWILPHPLIVQGANLYYDTMHFTLMIIFLFWLFIWHRDAYPRWRTTLALLTASSLLIQLIPVAPPRMVLDLGMVDTAERYGQSVYGSIGGFDPDQVSAMPSVHVGWSLLIAVCVMTVSSSKWRYLILIHPIATVFVVVSTGNHYWGDGIVAGALLCGSLGVQWVTRRLISRYRDAHRAAEPAPAEPGLVDAP